MPRKDELKGIPILYGNQRQELKIVGEGLTVKLELTPHKFAAQIHLRNKKVLSVSVNFNNGSEEVNVPSGSIK